jgi:hypothetical protein
MYFLKTNAASIFKRTDSLPVPFAEYYESLFTTPPRDSWRLLEDRADKYGWVSVFDTVYSPNASLSFPVNIADPSSSTLSPKKFISTFLANRRILVDITYLKTCSNAGMMEIYICGEKVASVDTLWHDFETFKVSTPDIFSYLVSADSSGTLYRDTHMEHDR